MLELAKNDRQDGYKCLEAVCECVFLLSTPRFQRLLNVRVRSRRRTLDMDEEAKESDKCSICPLWRAASMRFAWNVSCSGRR